MAAPLRIGIIGGSGLYKMAGVENIKEVWSAPEGLAVASSFFRPGPAGGTIVMTETFLVGGADTHPRTLAQVKLTTPFGAPSDNYIIGTVAGCPGVELVFLPRYVSRSKGGRGAGKHHPRARRRG